MRLFSSSLLLISLFILTGCPPAKFPFEDRWVLEVPDDDLLQRIEQAVKSHDPTVALPPSDNGGLLMQTELEFRINGAVTETITIGKQATPVEGEYQLLGQSNGEYRLKLVMGQKRTTSDVRIKVSTDRQTMTMWVTRDGKESESKWKRAR